MKKQYCPAPVDEFDYKAVHEWLQNNCWVFAEPVNECGNTSLFIQYIFGWPVHGGHFHSWNKKPINGQILDLTVEQFYKKHATRLVAPSTTYDGKRKLKYEDGVVVIKASPEEIKCAREWIRKLVKQLPLSGNFGLTQRSLAIRVNRALKALNSPRS